MTHRFKKNNYISDSESDEIYNSYSDSSETEDSLSSINDSDPEYKNEFVSKGSDYSSKTSRNSICEESSFSASSPEKDKSVRFSNASPISPPSIENSSEIQSKEKELINLNSNKILKRRSNHEKPIGKKSEVDSSDILVSDSSLSVVNESTSIIENSCNDSIQEVTKTPYRHPNDGKSRVIEESSESDHSVEYVNSCIRSSCGSSTTTVSPKENSKMKSNTDIVVLKELPTLPTHDSSNTSLRSNSSLSESGDSTGTQTSIHSNSSYDERKTLEHQLADKRTAYQNILRAVKTCDPKKLKDGGKLLQEKLARCKEEMDELKEKLKMVTGVPEIKPDYKISDKVNSLFCTSDQDTANLGKKGLQTHRVQAALTVDALVTLHGSLQSCPAEDALETDPKGLKVELMPHQRYALAWLLWREQQSPPGGILADDMGLGKTLTMIALVLRAEEYKKQKCLEEDKSPIIENGVRMYPGKTLVVCPSSLLGQWQSQIKQHCSPHLLSVLIHHGKPRELQAKKLAVHDIVISSYGVIVEENKIIKEDKKGPLFRVKWERVIIDEGHVIRNYKTKTAQAVCELETKYRWCLTGTPVQNKELDMYSLLKFLHCTPFDSLPVWKRWVDNKSANGIQRLNTVVKSILLRRTKEELQNLGELQQLPVKTSVPVYINLDEEEEKVYHTVLHFSKSLLAEFILQEQKKRGFVSDELTTHHRELLHSAKEIKATEIFVLLLRLRQICCLPGLIHSLLEKDTCAENGFDLEDDPVLNSLTTQMKRLSVSAPALLAKDVKKEKILLESNPVFEINRPSRKIQTVLGIIKEALEANDKIIVVSQWANLLNRLKAHIVRLKVGVVTLDGSVPVKLRPSIIEDFNSEDSDVKVMLLSLTAGGVGLNLMGGNRLVIFEPHWNPQLESQACDRIHRVGQKKPVFIYKIICKGTIEEKIELLQKKKLEIAKTVLKGELKINRSKLTLADLKILFDVHS